MAFFIIFLLRGIIETLLMGDLHNNIPSNQRATVESTMFFLFNLIDIPFRL